MSARNGGGNGPGNGARNGPWDGGGENGGGSRPSLSRLYRNTEAGWARGVCAGLADYFGLHVGWFRWGFGLGLVFMFLPTVVAYVVMAMILPEAPARLYETEDEARFWRGVRVAPERAYSGLHHRFRGLERRLRALEAAVTSREFRLRREIDDL